MIRLLALLSIVCFAAGCSFDRTWRSLSRSDVPASDLLAGQWEGRWISDSNGHNGKLRAILTPSGDSRYRADFDAMFFAILRAGYTIELTSKPEGEEKVSFKGSENLGSLAGGVYEYAGHTDGQTFTATYKSKVDHGRFEMNRPRAK